ncbi:type II toxin-antitoxin system RelE family toxin [Cryobacterium tagatosivorans]|uniref:type II toxin-antitoxin system RelE family toxin n=1 Tax=Cryobacterium tagatosivorans TaxID=1259199 RepID=UPI001F53EF70|nr:type II toxin-antitoxin system RelE/ParE family toxin [Cryobacterium tagatosivorans]
MADDYVVELSPAAARSLRKLDRQVQRRILGVLLLLRETPRPPAAKSLVGHPLYLRVRTGDYRIVYTIQGQKLLVLVLALGHRREVYRDL